KYADAEPLFRACLAIRERERPNELITFHTKARLGAVLLGQKKHADAEPLLLQGYEGMKKLKIAASRVEMKETVNWLIELYDAWAQKDKADLWRQQAK